MKDDTGREGGPWAMVGTIVVGVSSILKGPYHPFEWPFSSFSLVLCSRAPMSKRFKESKGQIDSHSFLSQSWNLMVEKLQLGTDPIDP